MTKLDSYSYHEALDRAFIQLESLQNALGEHPVILEEKEAKELYDKAADNLGSLYQLLGELSADNRNT
ncbi:MAG: hypothetical protein COB04_19045 [Gammaproteobacteria bacterium]|nr:MAG: hypothetical protein COB04_19045 [Gammaproteobacteria bacterium]